MGCANSLPLAEEFLVNHHPNNVTIDRASKKVTVTLDRGSKTVSYGVGLGVTDDGQDTVVTEVAEGGPADGVLEVDDTIEALNGEDAGNLSHQEIIDRIVAGTSIEITVLRAQQAEPYEQRVNSPATIRSRASKKVTVTLDRGSKTVSYGLGLRDTTGGQVVDMVTEGGPADGALELDDMIEALNGEDAGNLSHQDIIDRIVSGTSIEITVLRAQQAEPYEQRVNSPATTRSRSKVYPLLGVGNPDPPPAEYGVGLVSTKQIQLKVKEKLFSLRGDFTVKDTGGKAYCKVVGIFLSLRQRVVIKDMDGNPIACVLEKILSMSPAMFIYGFKPFFEGQEPTSEKQDGKPLYAWAKVWQPVYTSMYMIQMANGNNSYTTASYDTTDYKSWAPGLWAPRLSVVKGADKTKGGCCLIDRSTMQLEDMNVYDVTVAPGIDPILMVGLVICKDKISER